MDVTDKQLLEKFSNADIATIHSSVIACAVDALIATHPDPESVRRVFDALFAQASATLIVQGEPLEAFKLARRFADRLFDQNMQS
ncbi:hypothetical protein [Duganella vulcania]|uniref:Uncharacterized protein n=1 Tax=Duganella vulcania TaxID=2692166 RepID=A0A845GDP3_9BURK|nr:hypothetical protein [Duganella vulcania]MYM92394.1 hypothetical protein [Duganella vulcania]